MDIAQTIKQRAQERGVDPELALAIAKAESGLRPQIKNPKSSAHGLFQIVDDTWKQYGGDPKKRKDVNENIRIGLEILADNQQALANTLGRAPRPGELYAGHFFGKSGAQRVLTANPDAPVSTVVSERVLKANPELLKGKTVSQALAALGAKVGDTGPGQSIPRMPDRTTAKPVYREDPAKPPVISNAVDATRQYGAGYQAALALSYLSDTQEESDDPNAPSIVERDAREEMAEQRAEIAAAAAAPSGSSAASMLAKMDFGYAPVVGQPKAPVKMAEGGLLSRAAEAGVGIRPSYAKRLSTAEGWGSQAEYDAFADRAKKDADDRSAAVQQAAAMGFFNEGGEVSDPEAALFEGRNDVPAKPNMTNKEFLQQALYGVGDLPYVVAGAPVDLAALAMMPFGYKDDKPFMGSADIKARMTRAGIRPADTTDPRLMGPRTAAELLVSLINPAGATRSAARGAGEAARMLEDATVGNIQRGRVRRAGEQVPPDTAYEPLRERMQAQGNLALAVRERGTPFLLRRGLEGGRVDDAQNFIQTELQTSDKGLNDWFNTRMLSYLRTTYGSPDDQFVKAAEEGKLLHFVDKPTKKDSAGSLLDDFDKGSLEYRRKSQGFSPEGEAKTPYGKRVEEAVDITINPAELQDLGTEQVPGFMREMVATRPEARVTEVDAALGDPMYRGAGMDLKGLRNIMEEMRVNSRFPNPEYSVYGQPPVKIPEQYLLPDKVLTGLSPAQASNRAALFTKWKDENRQRMASAAVLDNRRLDRMPLAQRHTLVKFPDLEEYDEMHQLVKDVGCDGKWCTREGNYALEYGSGPNRLAVVFDDKARPKAQLTLKKTATVDNFLSSMVSREQVDSFQANNPDVAIYDDRAVMSTREYQDFVRNNPAEKVTELKGIGNEIDLSDKEYTFAVQDLLTKLKYEQGVDVSDNVLRQVGLPTGGRTQNPQNQ